MKYLFYSFVFDNNHQFESVLLDAKFSSVLWKPSASKIIPAGVAWLPFAVWWVMHYLHLFANQDYSLYLIYDGHIIIHRSVITPRYFRFPFMDCEDLQIGDTWTSPKYRGRGVATSAIKEIINLHRKPGRKFWYVVDEMNIPSIKVIEKSGFTTVGEGIRKKRMNLEIIGTFEIRKRY